MSMNLNSDSQQGVDSVRKGKVLIDLSHYLLPFAWH
jgi:hypothetical protein